MESLSELRERRKKAVEDLSKKAWTSFSAHQNRAGNLMSLLSVDSEDVSDVVLMQRDTTTTFEGVTITGSDHPGKVLGFNGAGILEAVDVGVSTTSLLSITAFGAVPGAPGAATNKAAIEAAAAAAVAAGLRGIYFPSGEFHSDTGIVIPKDCDVIMDGKLFYTGSANEAALSIGSNALNQHNLLRRFQLNVERSTISDWTDDACIGIRFYSLYQSHVDIIQCNGFTVGLELRAGLGTGSYYNTVRLGKLWNNKFAIRITNSTGGSCNSNKFFGGSLANNSGVNPGIDRVGIHITSDDGYLTNDNVFFGPSIELIASDTAGDCAAVLIDSGVYNAVMGARDEDNDAPFLRETGSSEGNAFETDRGRGTLTGKGPTTSAGGYNLRGTNKNQLQVFGVRDDGSQKWGDESLPDTSPHVEVNNQGSGTGFREFTDNIFHWSAFEHIFYSPNFATEFARIGGTGSAVLEVISTTQGLLPPRMTKAQRDAISSPADGLIIYQTDATPGIRERRGGAWVIPTVTADP